MPKLLGRPAAFVALWRAIRAGSRPGTPGIGQRLKAVPRMLGARIRGRYTELTWGRLGLMAAAIGYVLSPVDLLPELLLTIPGLIDDTVIVAWFAGALLDETERYIRWARGEGAAESSEPAAEVIDGEVVS